MIALDLFLQRNERLDSSVLLFLKEIPIASFSDQYPNSCESFQLLQTEIFMRIKEIARSDHKESMQPENFGYDLGIEP